MENNLILRVKFFNDLTLRELYEIIRARETVFLLEQRIVCQDLDRVDYDSLHCFLEQDGKIVAYLRAFRSSEGKVQIGRVLSTVRGVGLGKKLMLDSLPEIKRLIPCHTFELHAQKHAQGFYEKLGFAVTSDDFLEEGVVHVSMELSA